MTPFLFNLSNRKEERPLFEIPKKSYITNFLRKELKSEVTKLETSLNLVILINLREKHPLFKILSNP